MKQKKEAFPLIGKTVYLNLEYWGQSPLLLETFTNYAINSGWSYPEIECVKDLLKGKSYEKQMSILEQYCLLPLKNEENIIIADVQFLLSHLGLEMHYLNFKAIESWDQYDWSNYKSLKSKATSYIKRVFAFFTDDIEEEDKYIVTSPPKLFFETREKAETILSKKSMKPTKIFEIWIKNENK